MSISIAGVSEIGRKSFSTDFGGFSLGIGTTFAIFHEDGKTPFRTDELKITQTGPDISDPNYRSQNIIQT